MQRRGYPEDQEKLRAIEIEGVRYGLAESGDALNVILENDLEDSFRLKPGELRKWREQGLPFVQVEGTNKRLYLIRDVMNFLNSIKTILGPDEPQKAS